MSTAERFRLLQANLILKKKDEPRIKIEQLLYKGMTRIDDLLEMNGLIPLEHESGLRYIVNEEGSGQKPLAGDQVKIHFKGRLLDGSLIDSSHDNNAPIEFTLGSGTVIEGGEIEIPLLSKRTGYTLLFSFYVSILRKWIGRIDKTKQYI